MLLCEDHEIYRIGLRVLIELEPDLVVVGEVGDVASACSLADRVDPHVVVIRQGLLQHVQAESVSALCLRDRAVLILAETESELDLAEALRAGVRGYLSRRVAAPQLVDGIRALSKDELALDPAFARHLVQFLTAGPTGPAEIPTQLSALTRLTERQRAVALLVAEGMTNGEIAARLFVSDATVKSHLTAVLRRLGRPEPHPAGHLRQQTLLGSPDSSPSDERRAGVASGRRCQANGGASSGRGACGVGPVRAVRIWWANQPRAGVPRLRRPFGHRHRNRMAVDRGRRGAHSRALIGSDTRAAIRS